MTVCMIYIIRCEVLPPPSKLTMGATGRGGGGGVVIRSRVFYISCFAHGVMFSLVGAVFGLSLLRQSGSGALKDEFFLDKNCRVFRRVCVYGLVACAHACHAFLTRASLTFLPSSSGKHLFTGARGKRVFRGRGSKPHT